MSARTSSLTECTVEEQGGEYVVIAGGKVRGRHASKEDAEAQRKAIEMSLHEADSAAPDVQAPGEVSVEPAGDQWAVKSGNKTHGLHKTTAEADEHAQKLRGAMKEGRWQQVGAVYESLDEALEHLDGNGAVIAPLVCEASEKPGSRWACIAIREGVSLNRTMYSAETLREAVPLYDKKPVFWGHQDGEPDPRNTAGFLRNPRYVTLPGGRGAIATTLHATDREARERFLEAYDAGNLNLYGLSHHAIPRAGVEKVILSDGPAFRVRGIADVKSVDIVSYPSAGGAVTGLAEAEIRPEDKEKLMEFAQVVEALKTKRPDLAAKLSATPTEAEVHAILLESVTPPAPPATPAAPVKESVAQITAEDRQVLRAAMVTQALSGKTLPEAAVQGIRESLMARETLTVAEATAEVERQVRVAAAVAESVRKPGVGAVVEATKDEAEKLVKKLDACLDPRQKVCPSLRECYVEITGDKNVTGLRENAQGLRRFERLFESIGTADWPQILGDSIRRMMLEDYRSINYLDDWTKICSRIVSAPDYRTNRRVRLAGYGDLPTVAEAGPYTALGSPTDEEATYAVHKIGGTETITLETIANDDMGAVRRIPTNLSRAAKRTVYKAVFDLIASNATCTFDSLALFENATHKNLGSAALAPATVAAARLRMLKQTNYGATDILGLKPRYLIVPPDLYDAAQRIVTNPMALVDLKNATEANIDKGSLTEVIVYNYWTDSNDWAMCCDPVDIDTIEVGFLQGRREPELFVADIPNAGSLFTNDQIVYKIRGIFGVCQLDYRGFDGSVVAGS